MPSLADVIERHQEPVVIRDSFHSEVVNYEYTDAYQPRYPDSDDLLAAIYELHATEPVVLEPERIIALKSRLRNIARGAGCIIFTGMCNEPVDLSMPIDILVSETLTDMQAVEDGLRDAGIDETVIAASENDRRGMGQNAKPRSNSHKTLQDGRRIPNYYGDMINRLDENARTPKPSHMVAAAVQARDLRAKIEARTGKEIVAASEALLLAYVSSFIYRDPETDKRYLLSSHIPWLGERTNKPPQEGGVNPHVELLSQIENPIGVKLGPKSDAAHIKWLAEKLNPQNEEGKLIFMVRVGSDEAAMERIADGIKEHAPNAIVKYDIHGSTITHEDGTKVRAVDQIIEDIELLDKVFRGRGLRVRGLHLESSGAESTKQCVEKLYVDGVMQKPGEKPVVDPLLNPWQVRNIVGSVALRLV